VHDCIDPTGYVHKVRDVATDQSEDAPLDQMLDIGGHAGEEVVEAQDLVSVLD